MSEQTKGQAVSDTPRTDKAWKTTHSVYEFTVEMKRMERELNEANKTISLQHELMTTAEKRGVDKAKEELNEAKARIKRMEEAGDVLAQRAEQLGLLPMAIEGWIKAKDAKP